MQKIKKLGRGRILVTVCICTTKVVPWFQMYTFSLSQLSSVCFLIVWMYSCNVMIVMY